MRHLALVVLVACGGAPPKPATPRPPPFDAPALAAELNRGMAEIARILHARSAECPRLAADLRAAFRTLDASMARAREAQRDPDRARQLTSAMRAYDRIAAERMQAIEADLTVGSPCVKDPDVREVLLAMPVL